MFLADLLRFTMRNVSVRIIHRNGLARIVGRGDDIICTIRVNDKSLERPILRHPALFLPEALMEGELTVEDGTTYNYLDVLMQLPSLGKTLVFQISFALRPCQACPIPAFRVPTLSGYGCKQQFLDPVGRLSCFD